MTEHKSPVDHALDLFVYAPLGFALDAKALLPKLIDRGHDQVKNQVTMARMMGQFAVQQGQSEATKHLSKVQEQAATALADLGLVGKAPAEPVAPAPAPAPVVTSAPAASAAPKPASPKAPTPSSVSLAIPDYDSLAASQVIPRLAGLAVAELEAVRTYESAHRGRKTILNKIAQLQA